MNNSNNKRPQTRPSVLDFGENIKKVVEKAVEKIPQLFENQKKLDISYKIVLFILALIGLIVIILFFYEWLASNCIGSNSHNLLSDAIKGLIGMAMLILGYIAGSQSGK